MLERLAGQAVTQEGKERCLALRPMTDPDDVQRALDETSAAVDMSALRAAPPSPASSRWRPPSSGPTWGRAQHPGAAGHRGGAAGGPLRQGSTVRGDERKKTCIDHLFRP